MQKTIKDLMQVRFLVGTGLDDGARSQVVSLLSDAIAALTRVHATVEALSIHADGEAPEYMIDALRVILETRAPPGSSLH